MFELTGKIKDLNIDYRTGEALLTLAVDQKKSAMSCFDELNGADKLSVKIDKHREKRSLNANNYAWHLITEIANEIGLSKESLYEDMLRHYGQRTTIRVGADIDLMAYGIKYFELIDEYEGQAEYFVFKGSSEMDSKEMAILIDGIVQEATNLQIPTKSDEELESLLKNWEVEHGKKGNEFSR